MRSASGARPPCDFSGLPGVTSHQTRSSLTRFIASRQASRWARCGGSKVPPNRPMRMPGACGGMTRSMAGRRGCAGGGDVTMSRPCLTAAADAVLERRELLGADRTARMQAPGGDADLGAEAELAAVGELRRGVVQHDRGIDFAQELVGRRLI